MAEIQDTNVPASSDVNWADFAVDADDEGVYIDEPAVGQDTPVQEPDSSAPTAPASKASAQLNEPVQPPPVQQSPSPETQPQAPQQQTPPVQPQPQTPQLSREELLANYRANLETQYAISQEDAIALATTPETVLPRIATNLHLAVMQEVTQHIQQVMRMVPQIMEQRIAQQTAEAEAKQTFFGEWPGLQPHYDKVVQNALLVRQAHPQATREQVVEMAGVMTAMGLGLDPTALRKQATQPQAQPRPAQRPQIPPRPAAVGSGPNASPLTSDNVFSAFADEDMDFLRG